MAIDFPNAPATNATYTVGNKTWIYDGTTWNTYNSTSFSAETLPGTTIKSTVTGSSLTSVGTLTSLTVTGDVTVDTSTLKVDATNNCVGVNKLSPLHALDIVGRVETRAAATQDGIALVGRAGGSSSYDVALTPTTLTADRTLTLPDESGTVALTSNVGLVLVKSQEVTGTASSVVVTNAFSSAYDNYEIIYTGTALAGTDAQFICRLGSATTNYRTTLLYNINSSTPSASSTSTQQGFPWIGGGSGNDAYAHFKLFTPFLARHTRMETSAYIAWPDAGFGHASGVHSAFTSFTDFTLSSTAGTFTGGTIRVYGYRN
jgi:hypothetical protein